MDKVKQIKTYSLILFFLAIYTPIYSVKSTLFGVDYVYSVNATDMNSPLMITLWALLPILFALIANHLRPSLVKIADIIALVFMGLLLALLAYNVFQDSDTHFGIGFLIMLVATVEFGLVQFLPDLIIKFNGTVFSLFQNTGLLFKRFS